MEVIQYVTLYDVTDFAKKEIQPKIIVISVPLTDMEPAKKAKVERRKRPLKIEQPSSSQGRCFFFIYSLLQILPFS